MDGPLLRLPGEPRAEDAEEALRVGLEGVAAAAADRLPLGAVASTAAPATVLMLQQAAVTRVCCPLSIARCMYPLATRECPDVCIR